MLKYRAVDGVCAHSVCVQVGESTGESIKASYHFRGQCVSVYCVLSVCVCVFNQCHLLGCVMI